MDIKFLWTPWRRKNPKDLVLNQFSDCLVVIMNVNCSFVKICIEHLYLKRTMAIDVLTYVLV